MSQAYVSEFTQFMQQYLAEHPEVVEDQRYGRQIYWDRQVDFAAQENASRDSVPADGHGGYGLATPTMHDKTGSSA